jgi:ABC-2 type transport system ATP-binding protein
VRLAAGALPAELQTLVSHPDELMSGNRQYTLRVNDCAEVEPILSKLRLSGAVIDDMQLHQADLEDVFIQIMEGEK